MILTAFTLFHVALSLVGIGSGLIVVYGLLESKRFDGWTATFLTTTVATSVTGFLFPFHGITPGIVVGILSLGILAFAILARYRYGLAGALARNLCSYQRNGAVFQRVRLSGASVRESAGTESAGADTERGAF